MPPGTPLEVRRRMLRLLGLSALLAFAAGCAIGTCTAFCMPRVEVTVHTSDGSLAGLASGSVNVNDAGFTDFLCNNGNPVAADGGWVDVVSCTGGVLVVSDSPLTSLSVSIVDVEGHRFAGDVPFTLRDTGAVVCGSKCLVGSADVTAR
jgi:hypothetical protein